MDQYEYTPLFQENIGMSNIWRDSNYLDKYFEGCADLPDYDNLRNFDQQKKDNFLQLE